MVLDVMFIIIALLSRMINKKTISENIEKVILGRYLELQNKSEPFKNELCEVFSDDEAIDKIFTSACDTLQQDNK